MFVYFKCVNAALQGLYVGSGVEGVHMGFSGTVNSGLFVKLQHL